VTICTSLSLMFVYSCVCVVQKTSVCDHMHLVVSDVCVCVCVRACVPCCSRKIVETFCTLYIPVVFVAVWPPSSGKSGNMDRSGGGWGELKDERRSGIWRLKSGMILSWDLSCRGRSAIVICVIVSPTFWFWSPRYYKKLFHIANMLLLQWAQLTEGVHTARLGLKSVFLFFLGLTFY